MKRFRYKIRMACGVELRNEIAFENSSKFYYHPKLKQNKKIKLRKLDKARKWCLQLFFMLNLFVLNLPGGGGVEGCWVCADQTSDTWPLERLILVIFETLRKRKFQIYSQNFPNLESLEKWIFKKLSQNVSNLQPFP